MKIVVCVKQVPDTWAEKKLNPADSTLDRASVDAVINELDEYAIEEALQIAEANGGEVVVLSMGPDRTTESIRKALSMGAARGVHVVDEALHGACAAGTSKALAKAIEAEAPDLVIFGSESTDARMSVVPAMVAERLGYPQLTFANNVTVEGGTVTIKRQTEAGVDVVAGATPAVVSVVEKINEPRYPNFKGIMAAKKKPVDSKSLADLGLDGAGVTATSTVVEFADAPPRAAGVVVKDDGNGGAQIAEYLSTQKFI
ncbi:MAG: electron transfer flavoprotein subunit beta/FixA family protein [Candidatus Nanopelagicales bacterium]